MFPDNWPTPSGATPRLRTGIQMSMNFTSVPFQQWNMNNIAVTNLLLDNFLKLDTIQLPTQLCWGTKEEVNTYSTKLICCCYKKLQPKQSIKNIIFPPGLDIYWLEYCRMNNQRNVNQLPILPVARLSIIKRDGFKWPRVTAALPLAYTQGKGATN